MLSHHRTCRSAYVFAHAERTQNTRNQIVVTGITYIIYNVYDKYYFIFCQYRVLPMPMMVARNFSLSLFSNFAVALTCIPFVGS